MSPLRHIATCMLSRVAVIAHYCSLVAVGTSKWPDGYLPDGGGVGWA